MAEQIYDWIDIYEELANKLLEYKDNRKELIKKIETIFSDANLKLPTLEATNQPLVDICPFTVMGLFNRSSRSKQADEYRIKLLESFKKEFKLNSSVPTGFPSVPVLSPVNATFYCFLPDRGEDDINNLWNFFESALNYSKVQNEQNENAFVRYFNLAINAKWNGNSKTTMGLYWIAPNFYVSIDQRNTWFIYQTGKIPAEVVSKLPQIEGKITAENYLKISKELHNYTNSKTSQFKDFKELSYEAWRYSEEVNQQMKAAKNKKPDDMSIVLGEDNRNCSDGENSEPDLSYTPDKFLADVYMTQSDYDNLVGLLTNKKNIILQGAPGVGKTFIATRLAYSIIGERNKNRIELVQFHQSYSYEDFIEGYRPTKDGSGFYIKKGAFYNFCKTAENDKDNDYFFIIDEINRGNISKIFGELFMLIEQDKRDIPLKLLYSEEPFMVPSNVYIIGMMNTADRSLALIDYALRRRFGFYEIKPAFQSENFRNYRIKFDNDKFNNLISCVESLNAKIKEDESLGEGFCIGHSYFCELPNIDNSTLNRIVEYELIPLLKEYWFDEPSKIKDWSELLRGSIK